ncbi:MAG: phosphotransferase [Sulfurimonas sp.]|nr:phosphotransferase [Sulfurimonas sp.]
MGVKRALSLKQLRTLFPSYSFTTLCASNSGVVDTTYITDKYVVKYYERDIQEFIEFDARILVHLQACGLSVTKLLDSSDGWYLYKKLQGSSPKTINYFHIQALARFMAKFHAQKLQSSRELIQQYNIKKSLHQLKQTDYYFYKKLESLKNYRPKSDGFIHGDIFRDNTLFKGEKIAVLDFIDGANGSYTFDIAVALLSFNRAKRSTYTKLFLQTYNQKAPQKIKNKELHKTIKIAAQFYAILRIVEQKSKSGAKELIFW